MVRAQTPVQTVPPAEALLSLAATKAHLRLDGEDNDAVIESLIAAATGLLDGYAGILGRCLVTQTWRWDLSGPPCGRRLLLPLAPVASVSIEYTDNDGAAITLPAENYQLSAGTMPAVELTAAGAWPVTGAQPDALRITMVCGYGAAADVPAPVRTAALMLVGHWELHREAVVIGAAGSQLPLAVNALLAPYRRLTV